MEQIAEVLKDYSEKKVLLLAHKNADPDSICSAAALSSGLKELGVDCKIGAVESVSSLAKKVVEAYDIKVEIDPELNFDLIVLLDCSIPGQLSYFSEKFEASSAKKIIIDHHAVQETRFKVDYEWIDEGSSSTVEMVYLLLEKLGLKISKETAFILLYGIVAETAHLRYAKLETFKLMIKLMEENEIEFVEILNILNTPLNVSERMARLKATGRAKLERIKDYLIVTSEIGSFEASSARALLRTGADVSAVLSKKGKELRISMRSTPVFNKETGIDLGRDLAPEVAKVIGGTGSGHPCAAGVNGNDTEKASQAIGFIVKFFKEKL